jgi:glycosyltransferase involved in cell wall biosynthesis
LGESAKAETKEVSGRQRVLLIDLGAHFGGVENYLVSLAGLLEGEVDLYALCVLPELAKRLEAAGAKTTLLPTLAGALKPLRFVLALLLLPVLLVRRRIQIVQVNGFLEATLMLPARLLGCRTVYTRHGPFEMENYRWYRDPLRYLPRALARISVHLATSVVCVSETVGLGVRKIRPPVPVTVIPNWLAGQEPIQAARAAAGEPVRVVCASRLERYKGIYLVIEAMQGGAMRDLPAVELTVVGDGPYRGDLEELAAKDETTARTVRFAGFQRAMQPYYESADIFIMPSLGPEGLPMSSLEAMGRGLPCILSDLPVHREITDDGVGAMLFASGDVNALRAALQAMVADPGLRERFGREGYRIIGERYTAERVRTAYRRVFAGA